MNIDGEQETRVFLDLIKEFDVAMLTTRRNGHLRSRPMVTSKNQSDLGLWFLAWEDSGLVEDVGEDPSVNVSYSDPAKEKFVSVCGTAVIVRDPEVARTFWTPEATKWVKGKGEADTVLVKVVVTGVEYWDEPGSPMISMFNDLDLPFTGEIADLGESKELQLTNQQFASAERVSRGLGANRNE